jgi:hypothetical protein
MKRHSFFVLLLAVAISSYSQNLTVNPGFEAWDGLSKPVGWTTSQNCLKDSVFIKSGDYSCRHEGGTSSKYMGQTISVRPGVSYKLTFFYRTDITDNGNGCRIWCYWKDTDGAGISDPSTNAILRPSKYLKSEAWDQFTTEATAPPEAVEFYLEVRTYPNSVTYWDDFVFEESVMTENSEKLETLPLIYPNPVSHKLIIRGIQNIQHIGIYSYTGKSVWSSHFEGEDLITIPVSHFNNGIYIICIQTRDRVISHKFIKRGE